MDSNLFDPCVPHYSPGPTYWHPIPPVQTRRLPVATVPESCRLDAARRSGQGPLLLLRRVACPVPDRTPAFSPTPAHPLKGR
jgi:hypothetical protein